MSWFGSPISTEVWLLDRGKGRVSGLSVGLAAVKESSTNVTKAAEPSVVPVSELVHNFCPIVAFSSYVVGEMSGESQLSSLDSSAARIARAFASPSSSGVSSRMLVGSTSIAVGDSWSAINAVQARILEI